MAVELKRVKKADYDELVKRVGKPFADSIVSHLESEGKNLEGIGTAFKMPMPPMEDDSEGEDMEDDKGKNTDKSVHFDEKDMIMLSGMKQITDFIEVSQKNVSATIDEMRKQLKDQNNQIEQLKGLLGDNTDASRRQAMYFAQLTGQQPASKSPATIYGGGDPLIDEMLKNNHQADKPSSVFEQIKANAGVTIPAIPVPTTGNADNK